MGADEAVAEEQTWVVNDSPNDSWSWRAATLAEWPEGLPDCVERGGLWDACAFSRVGIVDGECVNGRLSMDHGKRGGWKGLQGSPVAL